MSQTSSPIAIVGAGAIGSLIAARLLQAGRETVLLARGAHLAALRAAGLRLTCDHGDDLTFPVAASDRFADLPSPGVVVVTLKAHQLGSVAEELARYAGDAPVVYVQNGVPWWIGQGHRLLGGVGTLGSLDPGGRLSAVLAGPGVVGAVAYMAAEVIAPGHVRQIHIPHEDLSVGPASGPDDIARRAAERLSTEALPVRLLPDIRERVWSKLISNASLNPICTLTRSTVGAVSRDPATERVLRAVMREVATIAAACGTPGLDARIDTLVANYRTRPLTRPSMLQDLELGRQMELDAILAAPLEIAARLGVPAPNLSSIHALIARLAAGSGTRGFRCSPARERAP